MESFPRFDRKELGAKENITGLKRSLVELVSQLKENFSLGYDAIVSDDTGGRIATLCLREIYKLVKNDSPKTIFIASGQNYYPKNQADQDKLTSYIKNGVGASKRVLLVTQYVSSGDTINFLTEQLRQGGAETVDIATLAASAGHNVDDHLALYVGGFQDLKQNWSIESHTLMSNITKKKTEYDPRPMTVARAIKTGEVSKIDLIVKDDNEFIDFAGITENDIAETRRKKGGQAFDILESSEYNDSVLSPEEEEAIQNNINNVRQLIKELAIEVVAEVWPEMTE